MTEVKYEISTDKARMNVDLIHDFLSQSYWSKGIPRETVLAAIEHSLCFGIFANDEQLGFARVITDYTTFGYLADVFIVEEARGKGLGKKLIESILAYPSLQGLRRWTLGTRDAHGLYAQFGFVAADASREMVKRNFTSYENLSKASDD
jgi:GNAT superfamily N-acetyltransferase